MRRRLCTALLSAVLLAPVAAAAQAPALEPGVAVASFDSAWTAIHRTHWDTTFNGVDWNGVRAELRPRAEAARTAPQLRAVINDMLARLRQSHFYLIPGEVQQELSAEGAGDGDAGFDVRLVEERILVTQVDSGGPAWTAGVRPGWSVEAVGPTHADRVLAALAKLPADTDPRHRAAQVRGAVYVAQKGPAGSPLPASFRDGRGRRVAVKLTLRPSPGQPTRFLNLPEMNVHAARRVVALEDRTRVGVVRFNLWLPALAGELNEAVDALRDTDGIVVDLRGNPGGLGFMAAGVAGHFIDRADTLAREQRRGQQLLYVVNPRRVDTQNRPVRPFAGPVAILTDALTASTSEFFAGGLQGLGRARVFGETTAGAALPALTRRLPSGDVLVHAIADFTGPRGTRFEGVGVVPDVVAPPTRAALLAGGDPALDAALRWISEQAP